MSEHPELLQEVVEVLNQYFDALYYCDVKIMRHVFHPKAIYATVDETPLLYRNMDEYTKVIAERESPASRNEARQDHIDTIELAGENTARARVRCSIGSKDFVDFLTLVKDTSLEHHQWRIIAKVFQIKERKNA